MAQKIKDYATIAKFQNFVINANVGNAVDAFIANGGDFGIKNRADFNNIMTGRKSYDRTNELYAAFIGFYIDRINGLRG